MSNPEQAKLDSVVEATNSEDAMDAVPAGALQSTVENPSQHTATVEIAHGGVADNVPSANQTAAPHTTAGITSTHQQETPKESDDAKEAKPLPREPHNLEQEQELIDYEVEDEDMIPTEKQEQVKPSTRTGEKQQPPRISWNEWAGPAAADQAKRAAEMKEMEKKDGTSSEAQRPPATDGRKHREDGKGLSGRCGRPDGAHYHHRDHRRFGGRDPGRDRSPNRRSYRPVHSRSNDGTMRRGSATSRGGMPPGMNYGKASTPHFVPSGSLKAVHPSARPMAARGMPPGLGVTGPAAAGGGPPPRNLPRPSQHAQPVENRRSMMKNGRPQRSRTPPGRQERFPRQGSPSRYSKYRRPPSPARRPTAQPPPVHRPRSPKRDGSLPYTDRVTPQRQPQRGRSQMPLQQQQPQQQQQQQQQDGHLPPTPYRQRVDGAPLRLRDGVPASPRRFIPPDKRELPYQRPQPTGAMEPQQYNRGFPGNAVRHPGSGRWSPPPRDHHPRRPVSPNMHRSGAPRRSPPPAQPPTRRPPRELSPPMRPRRDPGEEAFRRRDEPVRPNYFNPERDRRPYGGPPRGEPDSGRRMETSAGRYGNHHRDPPHSPGRNVKRQRHSPSAEQRFRRDPMHHRNLMNSPHENPPDADVSSSVLLRYPENECAWYYVDPQGNTQEDPRFADEHKQFMSVDVWKEGMQKKQLMTDLLQHNNP